MIKDSDRIALDKIAEIERLIKDFKEKFERGVSDESHFITLNEIERMWGELHGNTNIIYSDMLRELLSSTNERQIIRKKKENTKPEE